MSDVDDTLRPLDQGDTELEPRNGLTAIESSQRSGEDIRIQDLVELLRMRYAKLARDRFDMPAAPGGAELGFLSATEKRGRPDDEAERPQREKSSPKT